METPSTRRSLPALLAVVVILATLAAPTSAGAMSRTTGDGSSPRSHATLTQPADDDAEPQAHHCSSWLIASRDYTIPGWYPAAEELTLWTVGAAATFLWAKFVRISPPWQVSGGAGAIWTVIEASWITGKFIPGDRVVQYAYENCHQFVFYYYHYRNGAIYRSTTRAVEKGSCAATVNYARSIITGQAAVVGGGRYYAYCPNSYSR